MMKMTAVIFTTQMASNVDVQIATKETTFLLKEQQKQTYRSRMITVMTCAIMARAAAKTIAMIENLVTVHFQPGQMAI